MKPCFFKTPIFFTKSTIILIFLLLTFSRVSNGQDSLLSNEKSIISFVTSENKKIILVCDTNNNYLIFRISSKNKTEFEYPKKTKSSWKKIEYSYYLRGGGAMNEGLDLNYIYFTKNNLQYIIYEINSAVDDKANIGLKIIDLRTNVTKDYKGLNESLKGTLVELRSNELIKTGDKLFD